MHFKCGFDLCTRRHMWVEFVVGSRPCSKMFFFGYSGFPPPTKTSISNFQFNLVTVFTIGRHLCLAVRYETKRKIEKMGPLQLAVTWYKIHHAGEQATHWDIQNKENANLS